MVILTLLALALVAPDSEADLPTVVVRADNTIVDRSCRIEIAPGTVINDADLNGVLQIKSSNIRVEFAPGSVLRGAALTVAQDELSGTGIRLDGVSDVTIVGATVSGFKVGLHATKADRLTLERCTAERNFAHHLRSTAAAEDGADWLWPHANDKQEWRTNYGAAFCIEDSQRVTVRGCRVRTTQNGLIIDRVNNASIQDNDFSFLSGWGLAMWRSSDNLISRNALDFCIRGYSHGVYNRGQDSAGILMFEQCARNVIIENSATHGGDGFFGFGGKEALGEAPPPPTAGAAGNSFDYTRRGCNDNLLVGNDFSYAAAHGIEMTFSFGNRFRKNRLIENGICGIWGGYCQKTVIDENTIEGNGGQGGGEGGGINIEHGFENVIRQNVFARNSVSVALWDDDDLGLLKTPWALANHKGSKDNRVEFNDFTGEDRGAALRVRKTPLTGWTLNKPEDAKIDADAESVTQPFNLVANEFTPPMAQAMGVTDPVNARSDLRGRQNIVMTPWGPWDHASPLVREVGRESALHTYAFYKLPDGNLSVALKEPAAPVEAQISVPENATDGRVLEVRVFSNGPGVHRYTLSTSIGDFADSVSGTLVNAVWTTTFFPWTADPRTDEAGWRKEAGSERAITCELPTLRLPFGGGGPSELKIDDAVTKADLPKDRFGVLAKTVIPLKPGSYTISTRSDDGIRVQIRRGAGLVGGEGTVTTVIDDWTWHAPKGHTGSFEVGGAGEAVGIEVEYFELDGFAVLELELTPKPPPAAKP